MDGPGVTVQGGPSQLGAAGFGKARPSQRGRLPSTGFGGTDDDEEELADTHMHDGEDEEGEGVVMGCFRACRANCATVCGKNGSTTDEETSSPDDDDGKGRCSHFVGTLCGPCKERLQKDKLVFTDIFDRFLIVLGVVVALVGLAMLQLPQFRTADGIPAWLAICFAAGTVLGVVVFRLFDRLLFWVGAWGAVSCFGRPGRVVFYYVKSLMGPLGWALFSFALGASWEIILVPETLVERRFSLLDLRNKLVASLLIACILATLGNISERTLRYSLRSTTTDDRLVSIWKRANAFRELSEAASERTKKIKAEGVPRFGTETSLPVASDGATSLSASEVPPARKRYTMGPLEEDVQSLGTSVQSTGEVQPFPEVLLTRKRSNSASGAIQSPRHTGISGRVSPPRMRDDNSSAAVPSSASMGQREEYIDRTFHPVNVPPHLIPPAKSPEPSITLPAELRQREPSVTFPAQLERELRDPSTSMVETTYTADLAMAASAAMREGATFDEAVGRARAEHPPPAGVEVSGSMIGGVVDDNDSLTGTNHRESQQTVEQIPSLQGTAAHGNTDSHGTTLTDSNEPHEATKAPTAAEMQESDVLVFDSSGRPIALKLLDPRTDGKVVTLKRAADVRRLALHIFNALKLRSSARNLSKNILSEDEVVANTGLARETVLRIFGALNSAIAKEISRRDFVLAANHLLRDARGIGHSLESIDSAASALRMVVRVSWGLIAALATLLVFQVDIASVLVAVGTLLVTVSFAAAEPLRYLFLSLYYVLVMRPFEVGDRVRVTGHIDSYVVEIGVLVTKFKSIYNAKYIIPNHQLVNLSIMNRRESNDPFIEVKFDIGVRTTPEQLDKLVGAVIAWIRLRAHIWRPDIVEFYVYGGSLGGKDGPTLTIAFWIMHRLTMQEYYLIYADMSAFIVSVLHFMLRLGIEYVNTAQPVILGSRDELAQSLPPRSAGAPLHMNQTGLPPNVHDNLQGRATSAAVPNPVPFFSGTSTGQSSSNRWPPFGAPAPSAAASAPAYQQPPSSSPLADTGRRSLAPSSFSLYPVDPAREEAIRRVNMDALAQSVADIRNGPVAHTWTIRTPLAERQAVANWDVRFMPVAKSTILKKAHELLKRRHSHRPRRKKDSSSVTSATNPSGALAAPGAARGSYATLAGDARERFRNAIRTHLNTTATTKKDEKKDK